MKHGVVKNGTIILVLWTLSYFTPENFEIPINLVISGFVISNFISLFENMSEMGIDIPNVIKDKLKTVDPVKLNEKELPRKSKRKEEDNGDE